MDDEREKSNEKEKKEKNEFEKKHAYNARRILLERLI